MLAELPVNGKITKVLMHAPKAGVFFVLDRPTGKLVSGVPFVPGLHWFKGFNPDGSVIVNPDAHYAPGHPARQNSFARNWFPMSWSPKTGLMYMQASQGPPGITYPKPQFDKEGTNIGIYTFGEAVPEDLKKVEVPMTDNAVQRRSYLIAWDPVKQQAAWRTDGDGNGVLATAGNLVFEGASRNVMGMLKAFRADTGQLLWSYNTPNAILTSPVSYMIDGEQYLLMPIGATFTIFGGGTDLRARQVGRLVAFKLNGTATLPPDPPPAGPILAPPAEAQWTDEHLAAGNELYAVYCARCHGITTRNNNVIPDLKRSALLNNPSAWKSVVLDGILKDKGMISWARMLPPEGAETIRHYVQNEARKALTPQTPPAGAAQPQLSPTEAATRAVQWRVRCCTSAPCPACRRRGCPRRRRPPRTAGAAPPQRGKPEGVQIRNREVIALCLTQHEPAEDPGRSLAARHGASASRTIQMKNEPVPLSPRVPQRPIARPERLCSASRSAPISALSSGTA